MEFLESIPNISEGRDLPRIHELAGIFNRHSDARLLHYQWDEEHNRSVYTVVGKPEAVVEITLQACLQALEWIDMRQHKGGHPRIGAVDVVPFAPVGDMTMAEAVDWARKFGQSFGQRAQIPIYFYEDAALMPERRNLADIRRGEYEGLEKKLASPEGKPDAGAPLFNPRWGATIVGARFPVIAFNVNLRTHDPEIARKIARSVRYINGGFRFVKAISVDLSQQGLAQVSMNLTDYRKTPIHRVFETIRSEAARYGVNIASSEIVGLLPLLAVEETLRFYLQMESFSVEQIMENKILHILSNPENARAEACPSPEEVE